MKTNMQETSLEAYENIQEKLCDSQLAVLDIFYEDPMIFDWTNNEVAQKLKWSINRVTPRVFELRQMGVLGLTTPRKCKVTGYRALAWRVIAQTKSTTKRAEAPTYQPINWPVLERFRK
jgi:hypothetical protein